MNPTDLHAAAEAIAEQLTFCPEADDIRAAVELVKLKHRLTH